MKNAVRLGCQFLVPPGLCRLSSLSWFSISSPTVSISPLPGSSLGSFVHLFTLSFLKDFFPAHLIDISKLWIQQPTAITNKIRALRKTTFAKRKQLEHCTFSQDHSFHCLEHPLALQAAHSSRVLWDTHAWKWRVLLETAPSRILRDC